MLFLGVDIGSLASKGLLLDENQKIISFVLTRSRPTSELSSADVLDLILANTGLKRKDISYIVATGYGRISVPYAHHKVTEIMCHARGVSWVNPGVRTIIDIGGQDSKAISIDDAGKVLNFAMNEKCAAGTGRFLEVMASALEVELSKFSEMALKAKSYPKISNTCTVFAESEAISLMAQGRPKEEIALGLCRSIASRIYSMMLRLKINEKVAMSGGVSKNRAIVRAVSELLKVEIFVPDEPQSMGALGAALIAQEKADHRSAS